MNAGEEIIEQIIEAWDDPENHAIGAVFRVRNQWPEFAALLDQLVDVAGEFVVIPS